MITNKDFFTKITFITTTITDIVEDETGYTVTVLEDSCISCKPDTTTTLRFNRSDLTVEQTLVLKDEQIRLLKIRAEQAEFELLVHKLSCTVHREHVSLTSVERTSYDVVELVVKHEDLDRGKTYSTKHVFNISNLSPSQKRMIKTLKRDVRCDVERVISACIEGDTMCPRSFTEDDSTITLQINDRSVGSLEGSGNINTITFNKASLTDEQLSKLRSLVTLYRDRQNQLCVELIQQPGAHMHEYPASIVIWNKVPGSRSMVSRSFVTRDLSEETLKIVRSSQHHRL